MPQKAKDSPSIAQPAARGPAPHVQAGLALATQAKLPTSPRPVAAHVRAALSAGSSRVLQRADDSSSGGQSPGAQEINFPDWLKSRGGGDHPPNEVSVVDAHLPTSGVLVRHDVVSITLSGCIPNWESPEFFNFMYSVRSGAGTHQVIVVWPSKYKKKAPGANRLGWLPQLEFGALAGLTTPKKIPPGTRIQFTYKTMDGESVDLDFTKQ